MRYDQRVHVLARRLCATLTMISLSAAHANAPAPPSSGNASVLTALRLYFNTFKPESNENSLLAYATREKLDWDAVQNLFQTQVNDPSGRYAEWRGHNLNAQGSIFTTLRAATYQQGKKVMLVVNREWCQGESCQVRNTFHWQDGLTLKLAPEPSVIPLLRDQDFYSGTVPPCLKGVSLSVSYVPLRSGTSLAALPVIPQAAQQNCQQAGVNTTSLTRPLRLQWHPEVGKFRRAW